MQVEKHEIAEYLQTLPPKAGQQPGKPCMGAQCSSSGLFQTECAVPLKPQRPPGTNRG